MDIQGAEGWALDEMENLIIQSKNTTILTEFWPQGLNQNRYGGMIYLRKLTKMGFDLYDIDSSGQSKIPNSLEKILEKYPDGFSGHTNILCKKNRQPDQSITDLLTPPDILGGVIFIAVRLKRTGDY